nr:cuticle protein 7-like [Penaeus vannamei]
MNSKVFFILAAVAVAAADRRPYSYSAPQFSSEESGPAHYDFEWKVDHDDSGNDFGHQEARDGHDTQGSYYVQLPDGRLQTVRFAVKETQDSSLRCPTRERLATLTPPSRSSPASFVATPLQGPSTVNWFFAE